MRTLLDPILPHFGPTWPLLGHVAFKRYPGGKTLTSRVLGSTNPFPVTQNAFGTKNECFGVPVSMFLFDAHPFGPLLAPFWPPGPLLGHVGWKRSPEGKFFTSRVMGPPNPSHFVQNVYENKNECFCVNISRFLVEAPLWTPF